MRFSRSALGATGLAALLGFAGIAVSTIGSGSVDEVGAATTEVPTTLAAPTTTAAPATTVPEPTTTLPAPTTVPPVPVTEAPAPVEEPVAPPAPAPVEEPAVEEPVAAPEPVAPAPEPVAYAPASQSPAEDQFLALTNATRASVGLAALRSDAGLHAYAVGQAQAMAAAGNIYHSDISVLLGGWSTVGENVGVGPSIAPIHDALVASPGHYANIAHAGYSAMGVGVVVDANGRVWTAHVFGG